MSLSRKEAVILRLLSTHGKLYGLEMVEKSAGRLRRGTIYATLGQMEAKGYIESVKVPASSAATGGIPRRLYSIRPRGIRVLEEKP